MTSAFDQRLIQVGLQLDQGPVTLQDLSIYASGRIFGSALQNQCDIRVYNLTREQQNYILTQASPLKTPRTPILVTLDVGRQSYGTFRLFQGNAIACNVTQPPDIGISLQALTNNFATGTILSNPQPAITDLKTIAQTIANSMGLTLEWKATNKNIDNWSWNGSAQQQITKLNQMGSLTASVVNGTLLVLDNKQYRNDSPIVINASNGMVGVPQVTDFGVIVKIMVNNAIQLGCAVTIQSQLNPAANGTYKVIQINFEVASRDQPFWYTLSCLSLNYALAT